MFNVEAAIFFALFSASVVMLGGVAAEISFDLMMSRAILASSVVGLFVLAVSFLLGVERVSDYLYLNALRVVPAAKPTLEEVAETDDSSDEGDNKAAEELSADKNDKK